MFVLRGTLIQDSNRYNYDDQRLYVIHTNPKIRFHELKRKFYSVIKWSEIMYDLEINIRWQADQGDNVYFVIVSIIDDELLKSVIRNIQTIKIDWSLIVVH